MSNAIALGTFDGLHIGHRAVLDAVLSDDSVVVTFPVPPKAVLTGKTSLLMTAEDKCRALKRYGIRRVDLLDFETVRDLSPTAFLDRLCRQYHPRLFACGYDYRFGESAAGTVDLLKTYCQENGIGLFCADRVTVDGETVSSTRIRDWLGNGEIERANRQIYGGFGFTATVLHGDARGTTLGFSTVNQRYPKELAALKAGVYGTRLEIDGLVYHGVTNIGHRPTWPTEDVFAETHILDFSEDLYGRTVTLKPLFFLREERRFESVDALCAAVRADLIAARAKFSSDFGE